MTCLSVYTKINSKCIKDLNIIRESESTRRKQRENSPNHWQKTPKAQARKAKINIWDYIKLRSFQVEKETANRVKRQPREGEKIFANQASGNQLISRRLKKQANKPTMTKST